MTCPPVELSRVVGMFCVAQSFQHAGFFVEHFVRLPHTRENGRDIFLDDRLGARAFILLARSSGWNGVSVVIGFR